MYFQVLKQLGELEEYLYLWFRTVAQRVEGLELSLQTRLLSMVSFFMLVFWIPRPLSFLGLVRVF